MGILTGMLIAIGSILMILVLRSLTTLFHELGHAIPALLFTDNPVIVYVGTYGSTKGSIHLKLGRLQIFLRVLIIDWKIGMCQYKGELSLMQRIWITISGPIASLLIAVPLFISSLNKDFSANVQTVIAIFILAALIDFLVNVIPVSRPISMHDGTTSYNDGFQLMKLFARFGLPKEYFELEKAYFTNDHDKVIADGLNMIDGGMEDRSVYELTIKSLLKEKEYVAALALYERLSEKFKLVYDDFKQVGLIQQKLNNTDSAIKYFNQCLHLNYTDPEVLTAKGIIEQERGNYMEALEAFNSAIHYDGRYLDAILNRAHVAIKMREFDLASHDLEFAAQHDPDNPYLHFYYGMFHEARLEFKNALASYERAEALGVDHHGIQYRIATVIGQLN